MNINSTSLEKFAAIVFSLLFATLGGHSAADAQALDSSFQGTTQGVAFVYATVAQPDGKILVAGRFSFINNATKKSIVRLGADGTLDNSFDSGAGVTTSTVSGPTIGAIYALARQSDGKILIGGAFTTVGGTTRNHIARLNSTGSLDLSSFASGTLANSFVEAIVPRAGAIYVAGYFTAYNDVTRYGVARLGGGATFTGRTPFDFDGDGRADISVFRPSQSNWYLNQSSQGFRVAQFGLSTDKLAPADYDGDGKTDLAVYRNGTWYIKQSGNNQPVYQTFGVSTDELVPADYDGDGRADIAVWRGSDRVWYILRSSQPSTPQYAQFGAAGDIAVPSVYNR